MGGRGGKLWGPQIRSRVVIILMYTYAPAIGGGKEREADEVRISRKLRGAKSAKWACLSKFVESCGVRSDRILHVSIQRTYGSEREREGGRNDDRTFGLGHGRRMITPKLCYNI